MKKNFLKILVLFLIVLNLGTFFYFNNKISSESFESLSNKYPLIDPARNYIDQKHFITNIQPIRESLYSLVENEANAEISIYFEYLNTGANISINQDKRFFPASLIKMPTAMAALKKVERGEWNLEDQLTLLDEDRDQGYGQLYKDATGTNYSIESLLKTLLLDSDNTAHRILVRNLQNKNYNEILDGLGMLELFDNNYYITAKEYSRIFRSLFTSSFLKRDYSQLLLRWLTETPYNYFLQSGVEEGTLFAHKIGEHNLEKTYLDSGIVYLPNRPYILTVMIKLDPNSDKSYAEDKFKSISKIVYEYIKNY